MFRLWAFVVLTCGCATARPPSFVSWADEGQGAAPSPIGWWQYETPSFALATDLGRREAREAVEAVASEMAALGAIMGNAPAQAARPVQVVVFANGVEFEKHFGRNRAGIAFVGGDQTRVFLFGRPSGWNSMANMAEAGDSVLRHELAHWVLYRYFSVQPRWFAEGMAQFLESYRWSDDSRRVALGQPNLTAYGWYRGMRSADVSDLLKWGRASRTENERQNAALYGLSWALMHFWVNTQREKFAELLQVLVAGDEDAAQKADALLAQQQQAGVDQAIYSYIKVGKYSTFEVAPVVARESVRRTPLSAEQFESMLPKPRG